MNDPSNHNDCQPLIEAATLELYQKNIFRITGLPVDATPKEVARQAQKLQMMEEMGDGIAASAAFHLAPPPTTQQIREALSRMKEPEHRLVDEFFWYWPEEFGDSKNDAAIQALLTGDGQKAVDIWVNRENEGGSPVAKHNLAVMFHMYAVDWTNHHVAYDIDSGRDEKIKAYWRDAFDRWEQIADADDLWEIMKVRVRSLDDDALTIGYVRRMRRLLPQAFDRVNAEAALKFAEQGQMDWAKFHVDFMRQTNAGLDDVDSTAELVLGPTKKRVEQRLRAAKDQAEASPGSGPQIAAELMDQCGPLMGIFDLFHGADSHQRSDLFDEVAMTVANIIVSYQTSTNDNKTFVDLLNKALSFATGTRIRERLIKNISIGENNLIGEQLQPFFAAMEAITSASITPAQKLQRLKATILPQLPVLAQRLGTRSQGYRQLLDSVAIALRSVSIDAHNSHNDFKTARDAISISLKLAVDTELKKRITDDVMALADSEKNSMCYFCGIQQAVPAATVNVAMYGEVNRSFGSVRYRKGSVPIPCCVECKRKQATSETLGCGLWILCVIAGAVMGSVHGRDNGLGGAFIGFFVGWVMSMFAQALWSSSSGLKASDGHPEVKKLLANGWSIGDSPGRNG